jgi:hypothetical protein
MHQRLRWPLDPVSASHHFVLRRARDDPDECSLPGRSREQCGYLRCLLRGAKCAKVIPNRKPRDAEMPDTPLHRFLGGSPLSVILRLLVLSLIVGAAMVFFNLTPYALYETFRHAVESLIGNSIDSLRTIFSYVAYGAMVVVPIFIILRLLRMAKRS